MNSAGPAQALRRIRCDACGSEFDCGADAGVCWCMSMRPLPMTDQSDTAAADCLCPACLGARIAEATGA